MRPKLEAFGFSSPDGMFRKYLAEQCQARKNDAKRFLSIGAGNCDLEIGIGAQLRDIGYADFVIDCLDLNPAMLERGRVVAAKEGVAGHLNFVLADFNEWNPRHDYDAVIANQSLHHVFKLEDLLARIRSSLKPHGSFVVSDMIGRNGHQRWPEALEIVRQFWRKLPPSYRFNRQLHRYEELYENWDCVGEGFEGIRSQDILPLLLEYFHFQLFAGFANVIDPFIDRAFGYNFDPEKDWDRSFIDRVHQRDQEEIVSGRIGPTHMLAVLGNDRGVPTLFHEPLTPAFCLRKASGVAGAAQVSEDAYEWGAWPHPAQSELEIACERLKEAKVRITEQNERMLQLRQELEARTAWALQLKQSLEEQTASVVERTAWALRLEDDLKERTAWSVQLKRELEEQTALAHQRTDWAQQLNRELEEQTALALERTGWALQLNTELEERTARTLQLNREIEDRRAREEQLSKQLDRLSWAQALDQRFHRPLGSGFRMAVWVRDWIRHYL